MSSSSSSSKWSDLPRRLTTICVGIPILWAIWMHRGTRLVFWHGTHLVCAWEFARLTRLRSPWLFPLLSGGLLLMLGSGEEEDLLSQFFAAADSNISSTLFLFRLVLVAAVACIAGIPEEQALLRGLFLLTIPFRSWLVVASHPETGLGDTVTLLLTVWNCDSGALVMGRLVGNRVAVIPESLRNRLRRISPKKSVEGLLGGVAFGALTYRYLVPATWWFLEAYAPNLLLLESPNDENDIYSHCSLEQDHDHHYSWTTGLLLSLAAITGDLWESQMKRHYGAKDTSKLLPGHGGVLDRFDSSLMAVVLYHVLILLQEKNR